MATVPLVSRRVPNQAEAPTNFFIREHVDLEKVSGGCAGAMRDARKTFLIFLPLSNWSFFSIISMLPPTAILVWRIMMA
jgi:hypothetical protein